MKRASYRHAVSWIAENDEPDELDLEIINGFISVLLVADLFNVEEIKVARDVHAYRHRKRIHTSIRSNDD